MFFRSPKKDRGVSISLPPVMSFGEFCNVFEVLRGDVYTLGEMAGIVACQTVPVLDVWIIENWTKGDVPVPIEIQRLYDEAVTDLHHRMIIG